MGGYGNEALLFAAPSVTEEDERERRLKALDRAASGGLPTHLARGVYGAVTEDIPAFFRNNFTDYRELGGVGEVTGAAPIARGLQREVYQDQPDKLAQIAAEGPKAIDYAKPAPPAPPAPKPNPDPAPKPEPKPEVTTERRPFHSPDEAAEIASGLESAASRFASWQNDGSLGQILGDAGARELLDTKYAMENERIDKEAAANDPQRRDLEARKLDAAADEYIAKDRGQRLPTLGGIYDTKKPDGWTPGLFETVTDQAGRETFVNSNPRPAGPNDAKAAGVAQLMESLGAAYDKARDLPEDKRTAYIQEALIRLGFGGEMMGLGKDLLSQVAKIIEAQRPPKNSLEELGLS